MNLPRYYQNLNNYLRNGKVLIVYGPRQVGKTTLLKDFLSHTSYKYRLDTGDDITLRELFSSQQLSKVLDYAKTYQLIAIDEAQRIPFIGNGLKMIVDHIPDIRIIATGSSSFELSGQVGEPLTGRKVTLVLFPFALLELVALYNRYDLDQRLQDFLIFGTYPEVLATEDKHEKIRIIEEITSSYLLKDILEIDKVKNSNTLLQLLRLLAFQIGAEVSLSELAKQLGIDYKTVGRYLDILQKSFVLYNLKGFGSNLRKEITKKSKYYFYDNGIRNALISNFNGIELRNDIGMLWENFIFMERLKKRSYHAIPANPYFWRSWNQKEIDLIEEREGNLYAYEFKWHGARETPPSEFVKNYPSAQFSLITKNNYPEFIL